MLKRTLSLTTLILLLTLTAIASDRENDVDRTNKSAQVFKEIMNAPDQGIPSGSVGIGEMYCHHSGGFEVRLYLRRQLRQGIGNLSHRAWLERSQFLAIDGGSVGYQIGGSSTDIVMLFMNDRALQSLLSDKFKLGADASVAAGPVGRNASAGTDLRLNAEILSYSRAKGVFAGVSLNGAVVQVDKSGNEAMYGQNVNRHDILDGKVAVPASAALLLNEIGGYPRVAKAE